jgi:NADP-dependent 3-hydroxy acid dehydrogenase YdfG
LRFKTENEAAMTLLQNKWALITGATAGIGEATARLLAERKCHLILAGRRRDRLEKLKKEFTDKYGVQVEIFNFDISKKSEIVQFAEKNKSLLSQVEFLINNAGLARGTDPFQNASLEDWDEMIDTNIKGLLQLTRQVVPHMLAKQSGHIVNLGSVAGRWSYPGGSVYCATKFAVRAISESLRMDLLGKNIRVTNIEPGMVETEFSIVRMRDEEKAKKVYAGMQPLLPLDIAETILWCLSRPGRVNIQELVVFPTDQASVSMVNRT